MQNLTIKGLAMEASVGVETVRYYQRRGLMSVPASAGGIRRYDERDVARLRFIRRAQAGGFTLAEIGELLVLNSGTDRARAHEIARSRIDALDNRIAELIDVRESLVRLADDCENGQDGPCPIIELFG